MSAKSTRRARDEIFYVTNETKGKKKGSKRATASTNNDVTSADEENDDDGNNVVELLDNNDSDQEDKQVNYTSDDAERIKTSKYKHPSPKLSTTTTTILQSSKNKRGGKFKKRNSAASSSIKTKLRNENEGTIDENISPDDDEEDEEDETSTTSQKKISSTALFLDANDTTSLLERDIKNRLTTYQPATQKSQQDVEQLENILFIPSTDPVAIDVKLTQYKNPRNIEDEGLFHGDSIPISTKNQNRLEQRILKENKMAWFGQDGEIEKFPDPKRSYGVRIFYDENDEEDFQKKLIFVPAKLDPFQTFQLDSAQTYEITIDISSITFTHHPLFSKEHILASKLQSRYDEYLKRQELGTTERLKNKLIALREVVNYTIGNQNTLKDKIDSGLVLATDEQKQFVQNEERLFRYRHDLKKARLERDQSLWDDRLALISTLDAWKSLKALRQHQEYSSTPLKLNILTLSEDLTTDREKWLTELNQEFEDLKREFEEEHNPTSKKYRAEIQSWTKPNKPMKPKMNEKGDSNIYTTEDDDDGTSVASESKKSKHAHKFDAKKTKEEISKRFRQLNRLPGEPKIMLELTTTPITPTNELPKGAENEETRRNNVESCQLKIRILFNGKEVYRSKRRNLKSDFTAFFGLTIPILINEWPKSLIIIIWGYGNLGKIFCGEIKLDLPNSKTSIEKSQPQKLEFISDKMIKISNSSTGVGSKVSFEILGKEKQGIPTSGHGLIKIGWSQDEHGNLLCPKLVDSLFNLNGDNNYDENQRSRDKQEQLIKTESKDSSQIDPNDPNNARWFHLQTIQENKETGIKTQQEKQTLSLSKKSCEGFVLDDLMAEFDFCTMETLNSYLRLHLLQLRDTDVAGFKNYRMISPFEEDIPINILKNLEYNRSGQITKFEPPIFEEIGDDEDDLDISQEDNRTKDVHYNRLEKISQIRTAIMQLFESSSKQLTFEDLVIEEQIPDIGTLGLNLMSLFQPRRALRPERKERKKIQIGSSLIDTNISLVVNIVRATNLPMKRMEGSNPQTLSTEAITGVTLFKKDLSSGFLSPVKPFVEVSFKRSLARTITTVGVNPIWNQEIQLPLSNISSSNLNQINDNIYILLYDEVEIDILEDDRRRSTDIHQRYEKRWLGSVTIPFSTLYVNGRIEGTFKINSPSILLGYEYQVEGSNFTQSAPGTTSSSRPTNKAPSTDNLIGNSSNTAFITFFITLQPTISPTIISKKTGASGETLEVLNHVANWENKIIQKFPMRKLKALVMNSTGETLLATRYLEKIPPPDSLLKHMDDSSLLDTMFKLAHYVTLFPTLRSTIEMTELSLWLTSDIFIGTPGGGIDEQAILLACYFLYLEIPCWLLFGNAVLNGPTTFVLTSFKNLKKDDDESEKYKNLKNEVLIWNPSNGECYNVNGSFCPLQNVWNIIGKLNIWGNISPFELPQHLDWNFDKSSQWLPLFSKSISESKFPSLQSPNLVKYDPVDKTHVTRLNQYIERHLKEAFMIWRKTSRTSWNRHCSFILRRILPKLEQRKVGRLGPMINPTELNPNLLYPSDPGIGGGPEDESLTELRDIMTTYQMTGFPLQQPFINIETLTETVFATSLHSIDTPNIEFALAVYIKGYPANLFSVWIYLAALNKRK